MKKPKGDLREWMTFKKDGKSVPPIDVFLINDSYVLGVYPGKLSKFDILIKYRQKFKGEWSNRRTPKHIHWTVDILTKQQANKRITNEFLRSLLRYWERTQPIKAKKAYKTLSISNLLKQSHTMIKKYKALNTGEYSIKFLVLLAKLLIVQEKTNRRDAYMFKNLLNKLLKGEDIFSIVYTATHRGKK